MPISKRPNARYCSSKCASIARLKQIRLRDGHEIETLKKQIEENRKLDADIIEYLKEREAILQKEKELALIEYQTLEMKKQILVMREMGLDYKPRILEE